MQRFTQMSCALAGAWLVLFVSGCHGDSPWGTFEPRGMLQGSSEFRLLYLPQEGELNRSLSPGRAWPAYQDSINARVLEPYGMSPAQKYGEAFGVATMEALVSRYHGIDSFSDAPPCESDADCGEDGSFRCGVKTGASSGHCIAVADGSQAAWAAAALMWDEPSGPVSRSNVTFTREDIQALLALAYHGAHKVSSMDGCDGFARDERITYGDGVAALAPTCLGMGPAQFHLLLANYLGVSGQGFVEQSSGEQGLQEAIVTGYQVLTLDELSAKEANGLVGAFEGGLSDSQSGTIGEQEWVHLLPYDVAAGQVIEVDMQGQGDADLYVRIDRQPTEQAYGCRPYIDGPDERCELVAPEGAKQVFVSVLGESPMNSVYQLEVRIGRHVPETYLGNADVSQIFKAAVEVDYVTSQSGNEDTRVELKRQAYFEYLLELDAQGRIVGGEWLEQNPLQTPLGYWRAQERATSSLAGGAILFSDVESLLRESVGQDRGREMVLEESGRVAKGEWQYYGPFEALLGEVNVRLRGQGGNANLYVGRGAQPSATHFACASQAADSNERCRVRGPGEFFVGIHGEEAAIFDLVVRYVSPGAGSANP